MQDALRSSVYYHMQRFDPSLAVLISTCLAAGVVFVHDHVTRHTIRYACPADGMNADINYGHKNASNHHANLPLEMYSFTL